MRVCRCIAGAAWLLVSAFMACSTPGADGRVVEKAPSRDDFAPVSAVLTTQCGSLDCHGQTGRSLRLYGKNGLRLSVEDVPGVADTSVDEIDQNYLSLIALEPEAMAAVLDGASPSKLTLVQKARGAQAHKGNAPLRAGTPGDLCITSWLTGAVDTAACDAGKVLERPK